jgi:hypothetical protein
MRWNLKGFSNVRASFLPGILNNMEKGLHPKRITAFWEAMKQTVLMAY